MTQYKTGRHARAVLSLIIGLVVMLMAACGQTSTSSSVTPTAPAMATQEATTVATPAMAEDTPAPEGAAKDMDVSSDDDEGSNKEVADDEIREPQGDIDEFWDSFDWADLTTAEQDAWAVLGWDEESWDEETSIPVSEEAAWDELTVDEQMAAEELGYDQASWAD
jgi:hypothetical protein